MPRKNPIDVEKFPRRHYLKPREHFLAATWLKDADLTGIRNHKELAARIEQACGFSLTEFNARSLLETVDRQLPSAPLTLEAQVAALTVRIDALEAALGIKKDPS